MGWAGFTYKSTSERILLCSLNMGVQLIIEIRIFITQINPN